MTDRPILFSSPMVRALLDGTKTQTRRIVTVPIGGGMVALPTDADGEARWSEKLCEKYGRPGDRLWVRETFAPRYFDNGKPGYRADWTAVAADVVAEPKWKPSIFMRRTESRITLRVTAHRIERLQAISEADAIAEGCTAATPAETLANGYPATVRYASLWDSLNGKKPGCSWADNPWVHVVTFERVE